MKAITRLYLLIIASALLPTPLWSQALAPVARAVPANDTGDQYHLIVTTKGAEFREVTVAHATGGTIKLKHADGVGVLPLAEMPQEIRTIFGYDAQVAAFEAVVNEAERRQMVEKASQLAAEHNALLARQEKESREIMAIEASGLPMEVLVVSNDAGGCKAMLWMLGSKTVKGVKTISGLPVSSTIKDQQHTGFVHGLDAQVGATMHVKLYSFSPGHMMPGSTYKNEYAVSAGQVWRMKRDRAKKVEDERAARQAAIAAAAAKRAKASGKSRAK